MESQAKVLSNTQKKMEIPELTEELKFILNQYVRDVCTRRRKYEASQIVSDITYFPVGIELCFVIITNNTFYGAFDTKTGRVVKCARKLKQEFDAIIKNLKTGIYVFEVNLTDNSEFTIVDTLVINNLTQVNYNYQERIEEMRKLNIETNTLKCILPERRNIEEPIQTSIIVRELHTSYYRMGEYRHDVPEQKNVKYLIVGEAVMCTEHKLNKRKKYTNVSQLGENMDSVVELLVNENFLSEENRNEADILEALNNNLTALNDHLKELKTVTTRDIYLVAGENLKIFGYFMKDKKEIDAQHDETMNPAITWANEKDKLNIKNIKPFAQVQVATFKPNRIQYRGVLMKMVFCRVLCISHIVNGKVNCSHFEMSPFPQIVNRSKGVDCSEISYEDLCNQLKTRLLTALYNNEIDKEEHEKHLKALCVLTDLPKEVNNRRKRKLDATKTTQQPQEPPTKNRKLSISSESSSGTDHEDEEEEWIE